VQLIFVMVVSKEERVSQMNTFEVGTKLIPYSEQL